jgi:hypothetical protein
MKINFPVYLNRNVFHYEDLQDSFKFIKNDNLTK